MNFFHILSSAVTSGNWR